MLTNYWRRWLKRSDTISHSSRRRPAPNRYRPALESLENRLAPATFVAKVDALANDLDGDGGADPGDTLQYTISISNAAQGDFVNANFTDTPDANTALVAGSVTTTQGGVATGNGPGDTSVAVDTGTIAA